MSVYKHDLPLQELFFTSGQSEGVINITIMNDAIPEQDENFCVQLSLPGGGATLGNVPQSKMCYERLLCCDWKAVNCLQIYDC